nr:hypothetical protein [Tanacetum cinerariifolium]
MMILLFEETPILLRRPQFWMFMILVLKVNPRLVDWEMRGQLHKRRRKRKPYHHEMGDMHAVLIVGIDIDDENPSKYFCNIKYAWGENWAQKRFTDVGF